MTFAIAVLGLDDVICLVVIGIIGLLFLLQFIREVVGNWWNSMKCAVLERRIKMENREKEKEKEK